MGPQVCTGLKKTFGEGSVSCQGVGPIYKATLPDNVLPAGTTKEAIAEATGLFQKAATKCPQTTLVAGGFR